MSQHFFKPLPTTAHARDVMDKQPTPPDKSAGQGGWGTTIGLFALAWWVWGFGVGGITRHVSMTYGWGTLPVWIVVGLPPAAAAVILLLLGGIYVRDRSLKKSYQRLRKQDLIVDIDVKFVELWSSLCCEANLDPNEHSLDRFPELVAEIKRRQDWLVEAIELSRPNFETDKRRIDAIEQEIEQHMKEVIEPIATGQEAAQRLQHEADQMVLGSRRDALDAKTGYYPNQ